jgi:two-component system, chemotaxis family, sensor kinase CheA
MDDLLSEFLTETSESLDALDTQLITLEQDPNDAETLNNIFRMVHTVKGTCGFLGLPRLESVAHAAENILGKFRDGELPVTGNSVTLILESIDTIKSLLLVLEETEAEPEGSDGDLIGRLNAAAGMGDAAPAPEPAPEPEPVEAPAADAEIGANIVSSTGSEALDALEAAFQAAPGPDEIAAQEAEAAAVEEPPVEEVEEVVADVPAAIEAVAQDAGGSAAEGAKKESSIANQSIRVSVDLLENLMNMVSELVLTRNQLLQMVRRMDDSEFAVPLQRLSHCTTELQEGVMQTRMQPIGNAWSKLPRIIRDLSNELDKKIDLVMNGAETELDRQVLELIKDPLTHMVRNSADHNTRATGCGG